MYCFQRQTLKRQAIFVADNILTYFTLLYFFLFFRQNKLSAKLMIQMKYQDLLKLKKKKKKKISKCHLLQLWLVI